KSIGVSQQPFEEIVAEHGPTVLRVCRAVLGRVDAEDAWSETFLAALSAYPRLRANSNIEAWLVTIAHRKALDHLRAASRRLVVAYRTIETPVGTLLLAATAKALVRVAYASEDHDLVLERLARDVSPRILRAPARLDGVAREIEEYFARRRSTFDVPLDLQLSH